MELVGTIEATNVMHVFDTIQLVGYNQQVFVDIVRLLVGTCSGALASVLEVGISTSEHSGVNILGRT